jgi:hypothetical protein
MRHLQPPETLAGDDGINLERLKFGAVRATLGGEVDQILGAGERTIVVGGDVGNPEHRVTIANTLIAYTHTTAH